MCAAEIVHYRVDQVVKKTWNGLKEQAHLVLHHNKTINRMLACLEKLEEEWLEIDQYQKLLEVVIAQTASLHYCSTLASHNKRQNTHLIFPFLRHTNTRGKKRETTSPLQP